MGTRLVFFFFSSFFTFLTPSRQPLNDLAKIWPAYCQVVSLENRVVLGYFRYLFLFPNNRHFFKGSADDLSPLTFTPLSQKNKCTCQKSETRFF